MTQQDAVNLENLFEWAKENVKKLDKCRLHNFERMSTDPKSPRFYKWQCTECKGEVDNVAKIWYHIGFTHGTEHPSPGAIEKAIDHL